MATPRTVRIEHYASPHAALLRNPARQYRFVWGAEPDVLLVLADQPAIVEDYWPEPFVRAIGLKPLLEPYASGDIDEVVAALAEERELVQAKSTSPAEEEEDI